jgi:hypothetical protein
MVTGATVLCFCIVGGGFTFQLTHQREALERLNTLAGLARAVENTVAIGAYARDEVLLGEVADGMARNELVEALEICWWSAR